MLISPSQLKRWGVMGMNQRNLDFIGRNNDRAKYPLVDNKLKTKRLAQKHNVRVPQLLHVVERQYQIADAIQYLKSLEKFVVKPAKGSGGKGILVFDGRSDQGFIKASGAEVSFTDLERHLSNILAGLYSLSGVPDVVIIESVIEFDDSFAGISHEGVPDIRLIVYKGFPVMAMLRCATKESDGKANLHQGAVGVGLDITNGHALHAMQKGRLVSKHPDTGHNLSSIRIPNWHDLLMLAAECYDMTELGYLGTDIILDKYQGPMLLELNARPGLAIQIANRLGLLKRLSIIDSLEQKHRPSTDRVKIAIEHFNNS